MTDIRKDYPEYANDPPMHWRIRDMTNTMHSCYEISSGINAYTVATGIDESSNARLIAAAPDLLAACRSVAGVFQDSSNPPIYAQKCIAAIAKATGEA